MICVVFGRNPGGISFWLQQDMSAVSQNENDLIEWFTSTFAVLVGCSALSFEDVTHLP